LSTKKTTHSPEEEASVLATAIATTAAGIRDEARDGGKTAAEILHALLIILEDPELQEMAKPYLSTGDDASTALFKALDVVSELMGDDEEFQSRVNDLRGIAARISAWVRGLLLDPPSPRKDSGSSWHMT